LQDVRDGFVSIEAARRDYGVSIVGDAVDEGDTRRLRGGVDATLLGSLSPRAAVA
jgi:hypothetical protein